MNAHELADVIQANKILNPKFAREICAMLRQQEGDKDRALRTLREVDEVLLDYIEQLEQWKPMTILSHGRGVALAVKYMIAVLEDK